jgi:DNA-binding FrmR family transcriptional regulator
MKADYPSHQDELARLKKIEGQIKGIRKMVEGRRYCIDILTQLSSVVGAVKKVEENILNRHLRTCVKDAFEARARDDKTKKVEEIIDILGKFRKHG